MANNLFYFQGQQNVLSVFWCLRRRIGLSIWRNLLFAINLEWGTLLIQGSRCHHQPYVVPRELFIPSRFNNTIEAIVSAEVPICFALGAATATKMVEASAI